MLRAGLQTVAIKRAVTFAGGRSCLQAVKQATLVKHNKTRCDKMRCACRGGGVCNRKHVIIFFGGLVWGAHTTDREVTKEGRGRLHPRGQRRKQCHCGNRTNPTQGCRHAIASGRKLHLSDNSRVRSQAAGRRGEGSRALKELTREPQGLQPPERDTATEAASGKLAGAGSRPAGAPRSRTRGVQTGVLSGMSGWRGKRRNKGKLHCNM